MTSRAGARGYSRFQAELRRLDYPASPVKKHFYLLARMSRRLDELGLDVADVATPRVELFFAANGSRCAERAYNHRRPHEAIDDFTPVAVEALHYAHRTALTEVGDSTT